MGFVVRVVRTARDLVFGSARDEVGLRHRSGVFFTGGAPRGEPVRFASVDEADSFRRRFLDEASAWCPVALQAAQQAA
jgi:hypothetical protein